MGKIAIYTRVSTEKQANEDRYSLTVQKERCEALLKSQGYSEEDFLYFTDAGVSGTTVAQRDELKELLRQLKEHDSKIEGICCYDLSRLSRSISDTLEIFKLLKENNLKLYTADGAFMGDLNSQNAKIMISIFSMLNELFVDQLRERVTDGMTKSVANGNYYGGPAPFGYKYQYYSVKTGEELSETQNKNTKRNDIKKRLVIDEEESKVVKLIFDLYTNQKYSIKKVTEHLNTHGYKTRKNTQFRTNTVKQILENPTYCSRLFWSKRKQLKKTEDGVRVWQKTSIYDINFYYLPRANHEAIISEDLFLETLERLRSRRLVRKNQFTAQEMKNITKAQYDEAHKKMFINILYCPNCGGKMTSSLQPYRRKDGTIIKKVYYKCSSYNSGKNICNGYYSVQEDKVFDMIKKDFFECLQQAFLLVKEYQNYLKEKYGTEQQTIFEKEIERLQEDIKQLEKNKKRLMTEITKLIEEQLIEDKNSIKYQIINEMIVKKEEEIKQIEKEIEKENERIRQEKRKREILIEEAQQQEKYTNIEEYFYSLTLLQKRQLLEKVYKKIVINTVANARRGPRFYEVEDIRYNEYSSVFSLCKTLGVQDFNEFYEYLYKVKNIKLSLLEKYFVDVEEMLKEADKQNSKKMKEYIDEMYKILKEREQQTLNDLNKLNKDEIYKILDEYIKKQIDVDDKAVQLFKRLLLIISGNNENILTYDQGNPTNK